MNLSLLLSEERELLARFSDLRDMAQHKQTARFSAFCNERQQLIGTEFARQTGETGCLFFGGYPDAVRRVAGFFPSWQSPAEEAFPIGAVTVRLPRDARLSHRDFLGSLMALRITRESVGDIVTGDGKAVIFTLNRMVPVIADELKKVGSVGVKCEAGAPDFAPSPQEYTQVKGTVPSLRVDCLVHLLTGKAREKSADLIRAEQVQLNYSIVDSISRPFGVGDVVTIRGFGKYKVDDVGTPTKKGRLPVVCSKYQ